MRTLPTLPEQLAVLESIDPTAGLLQTKVSLSHALGSDHTTTCSRFSADALRERRLQEVAPSCSCVDRLLPTLHRSALTIVELHLGLDLEHDVTTEDVLSLNARFRGLRKPYKELQELESTSPPGVEDLLEGLRTILDDRYAEVKGSLRSERARSDLLALCPSATPGGDRLVLLTKHVTTRTSPLVDAVLASFWHSMPVPGEYLLVAPPQAARLLAGESTHAYSIPRLGGDTDEVLETAARLWDPRGPGAPFQDFRAALEAARSLER